MAELSEIEELNKRILESLRRTPNPARGTQPPSEPTEIQALNAQILENVRRGPPAPPERAPWKDDLAAGGLAAQQGFVALTEVAPGIQKVQNAEAFGSIPARTAQSEAWREEAAGLAAEMGNMPEEGREALQDEINLLGQRAADADVGATTPSARSYQGGLDDAADYGRQQIASGSLKIGALANRMAEYPSDPRAANVLGAEGFFEAIKEFTTNGWAAAGVTTREAFLRSLPAMSPTIVASVVGTATAGPTGGGVAAGSVSAATEYGMSVSQGLTEKLQEAGVDMNDEAAVMQALDENPAMLDGVLKDAAERAISIGAFDALGARIVGGLTAPVGLSASTTRRGSTTARVSSGAAAEGVTAGLGEATAQIATEGEITEGGGILGEIIGQTVGGAPQAAGQMIAQRNAGGGRTGGPTDQGTTLDAEIALEDATLGAQQEAAAAAEAEAQQAAAAIQDRQARETRLDYATTFSSSADFIKQRENQIRTDVATPGTEAATAYREFLVEREILPTNEREVAAAVDEFVKATKKSVPPAQMQAEYRAALDEHIAGVQALEAAVGAPQAAPAVEAQAAPAAVADAQAAPATEVDATVAPAAATETATVAPAPQVDAVELAQKLVENTGIILDDVRAKNLEADIKAIEALPVEERASAVRAVLGQYTSPEAKVQKTASAATAATVAPQAREYTPTTPTRGRDDAKLKADALLPEGWIESADTRFEDVQGAVNGTSFSKKKFDTALAKALAEPQDAVAVQAKEELMAGTAITAVPTPKGLSKNQSSVWDIVSNAFLNNEIDTVMDANGSWNFTNIAKLAGLKSKQAAQSAIKQIQPKIAKTFDMTSEEAVASLRETEATRKKEQPAEKLNDAETVFDPAELADGKGMGTVASINQGAKTGVDAEDVAYTAARSEEPNVIAEKRAAEATERRRAADEAAVAKMRPMLARTWDTIRNGSGPTFGDLSPESQADWMHSLEEWSYSNATDKDATLRADFRALEQINPPKDKGASDGTENIGARQVEAETKPQETRTPAGGKQAAGRKATPDGGARAKKVPVDQVEDAEVVAEAPGGAKPKVDAETEAFMAERAKTLPPKELRNQASFKESYAEKNGRNKTLWENPNIRDAAEFADWLGSLTQEQWDIINPQFRNEFNPFKNAGSLDAKAAQAKFEALLAAAEGDVVDAQPDTGVRGAAKPPTVEVKRKKNIVKPPADAKPAADGKPPVGRFSRVKGAATTPTTTRLLERTVDAYYARKGGNVTYPGGIYSRLNFHETVGDAAKASRGMYTAAELRESQGFIDADNQAHFIAENIERGDERAVVDHEVGVHLGLEADLTVSEVSVLASAVNQWAKSPEGSVERDVHDAVIVRLAFARATGMDESLADIETIAYAAEEAALRGVEPSAETEGTVAKWLADLSSFFENLFDKIVGGKPALTVEQLVAIVRAAADGVVADIIVETGAVSDDPNVVGDWYMGTDKGRIPDDDAFLGNEVDGEIAAPGTEFLVRGPSSKLGPYENIVSDAEFTIDVEGDLVMYMRVQTLEDLEAGNDTAIATMVAGVISPNNWSLTVYGPDNGESTTLGLDGDMWSRIEGVRRSEVTGLLMEARRRLTRYQGGRVPHIHAQRVTGAAAANNVGPEGRIINYDDTVLRKRFSQKPPKPGTNASKQEARELRDWVGDNLGTAAQKVVDDTKAVFDAGFDSLKPISLFIRDHAKTLPALGDWYNSTLAAKQTRRAYTNVVDEIANRARALAPERLALVNNFLSTSTFFQKWGYDPEIEGKDVKVDPIMKKKFDRLTAKEQRIVKDIFNQGEVLRADMNKIAKDMEIDKLFVLNSKLDGPYAPLKRFGNKVVILKSQALLDAEKAAEVSGADGRNKKVDELKSDPKHYVVQFFDTKGSANQFRDANKGSFAYAASTDKAPDTTSRLQNSSAIYQKVLAAINAEDSSLLPTKSKQAAKKLVEDLLFQSLDERSARLSGARRMNIAGYDQNMIRSFVSHGRSQASLIAQMKHGGEINMALVNAQKQVSSAKDTDVGDLQRAYNTIAEKNADLMTPRSGLLAEIENQVLAFNTTMMLSTSLGYHVINRLQPIISVAKIASDFGRYDSTWAALFNGNKVARGVIDTSFMRQVGTVVSMGFVNMNNKITLDISKAPEKYQKLLKEMQLRDLLDVGMEEDLNLDNRKDSGYKPINNAKEGYANLTHRLYQVSRYVEASNRVSSAIAAFDMAQKNPAKLKRMEMTAQQYAINVVQDTQGDFSAEETSLLFSKLPRVTTQFRKYQIMMAFLHGRAFKAVFDKRLQPWERAAGARLSAYLLATTGTLAGAIGIPGAGIASLVFSMLFGDEDEPEDLERSIRDNIDDPQIATLVARGLPAMLGLDLSTKTSLSDVFQAWDSRYAAPSTDRDEMLAFVAKVGLGPTAGNMGSLVNAADFWKDGNLLRAAEAALPKGGRTLMESWRLSNDGFTTRRGDVIAPPEEFDLFDLVSNMAGLPSTEVANLKWTYYHQMEIERWFGDRQSQITNEYLRAYDNNDRPGMREAEARFRSLQGGKDNLRPFFNGDRTALRRSRTSSLRSAVRERRKEERQLQTRAGIR